MDIVYRLFGLFHYSIKRLLRKPTLHATPFAIYDSLSVGIRGSEASDFWHKFISHSTICNEKANNGLHYAGYIAEAQEWCLPSWIWTNAAIVRMYCETENIEEAEKLVSILSSLQLECGGWIVRDDFDEKGRIPMLAPNDSAYIASNAFLPLYRKTNNKTYLDIAKKCADWILETAREDKIVHTGYNLRDKKWDTNNVIVDIGFTANLFAQLVELTQEKKYKDFLECFIHRYIELFYITDKKAFCTSINKNNRQQGGMFGRGQAWALEGLIPAYKILRSDYIKKVIEATIETLIREQDHDGSWPYNLDRKLMGEDCKAVSVIAKNLMEWHQISPNDNLKNSALKAYEWCCKHTSNKGATQGGIFSYCIEGAIVHNLYSSCAFTYASAYAIELKIMLAI